MSFGQEPDLKTVQEEHISPLPVDEVVQESKDAKVVS